MKKPSKNAAYIENANLHQGCLMEGFYIDYKKLFAFLVERFGVEKVFLFTGYIPTNEHLYSALRKIGYHLIFRETTRGQDRAIKANCDADLVVAAMSDYYEGRFEKAVLISSDGDFVSLVRLLSVRDAFLSIVSPALPRKCSQLLKTAGVPILYLPAVRPLVENEKPPKKLIS